MVPLDATIVTKLEDLAEGVAQAGRASPDTQTRGRQLGKPRSEIVQIAAPCLTRASRLDGDGVDLVTVKEPGSYRSSRYEDHFALRSFQRWDQAPGGQQASEEVGRPVTKQDSCAVVPGRRKKQYNVVT